MTSLKEVAELIKGDQPLAILKSLPLHISFGGNVFFCRISNPARGPKGRTEQVGIRKHVQEFVLGYLFDSSRANFLWRKGRLPMVAEMLQSRHMIENWLATIVEDML